MKFFRVKYDMAYKQSDDDGEAESLCLTLFIVVSYREVLVPERDGANSWHSQFYQSFFVEYTHIWLLLIYQPS